MRINKSLMMLLVSFIPIMACGEGQTLHVGVIAPLSGDYATIGKGIVDAMKLASEESQGRKIVIRAEDNRTCLSPDAVSSFYKLRTQGRLDALVTVCTAAAQALLPIAQKERIPLIQLTESGKDPDNYMIKMMPSSAGAMSLLGRHFAKTYKTMAIIADNQPVNSGELGNVEQLRDSFTHGGGKVVFEQLVDPALLDFRPILPALKRSQADVAVPILGSAAVMAAFLRQADEHQLWKECRLGGNWAFEFLYAELSKIFPPVSSYEGLESTNLKVATSDAFARKFEQVYGYAPTQFADYGYDSIKLIAGCGLDRQCLTRPQDGASGEILFDDRNQRVGRFVLKRLRSGKWAVEG